MPYYHCRKCQHEYEGFNNQSCGWCGADKPIVLEDKTPLEILCEDPSTIIEMLKEMNDGNLHKRKITDPESE